jgi:hypothetical protein
MLLLVTLLKPWGIKKDPAIKYIAASELVNASFHLVHPRFS